MGKHRVVKVNLELVLPADSSTEETLQQLQEFLLDTFAIDDMDWAPFDASALVIELVDDQIAYIDDEEDKQRPPYYLEPGEA